MKTQPFHLEVLAVLLLSVIPWPGPTVFKISCPRDRASVVRRIVHKRWMPILKKYQVELPLECPFHESRDIFRPQQKAKHQHRPSQWTCGLCGKSFYAEKHLEAHFDNRHKSAVNLAEDAVCLADYCDIMRCDVLGSRDFESSLVDEESAHLNTDIQVWKEATEQRISSVTPCEPRRTTRSTTERSCAITTVGGAVTNVHEKDSQIKYCQSVGRSSLEDHQLAESSYGKEVAGPEGTINACEDEEEDEEDADDEDEENLVEAALPAVDKKQRRKSLHLRKLKSNCKPEELQKLKLQCEVLVRDCIAGLLANLSVRDFQEIEGELNRAICWYLSCDRYWEDTKRHQRHTPCYLFTIFVVLLSTSVYACYYVVWVLFNSGDEASLDGSSDRQADYNESEPSATSPLHDPSLRMDGGRTADRRNLDVVAGEEGLPGSAEDMPDHYIYVAYPPELKRRLIESCYNRTTRL